MIPVITPTCPGEVSRVLHPPRSGASGSSAKGRSATRSDSQRSHGRTRWMAIRPGDKPCGFALPTRRRRSEASERRTVAERLRPQKVDVGDGRLATTRRPFRVIAGQEGERGERGKGLPFLPFSPFSRTSASLFPVRDAFVSFMCGMLKRLPPCA